MIITFKKMLVQLTSTSAFGPKWLEAIPVPYWEEEEKYEVLITALGWVFCQIYWSIEKVHEYIAKALSTLRFSVSFLALLLSGSRLNCNEMPRFFKYSVSHIAVVVKINHRSKWLQNSWIILYFSLLKDHSNKSGQSHLIPGHAQMDTYSCKAIKWRSS